MAQLSKVKKKKKIKVSLRELQLKGVVEAQAAALEDQLTTIENQGKALQKQSKTIDYMMEKILHPPMIKKDALKFDPKPGDFFNVSMTKLPEDKPLAEIQDESPTLEGAAMMIVLAGASIFWFAIGCWYGSR